MRVGIISVYTDYQRRGEHKRGVLQPQVGPLIAGFLPEEVEIEIVNDMWEEPDFSRDYDLLFLSALHSDFDRAKQLSHYWRRRGAKTVFGGTLASNYPQLCQPYFDSIVVGDAEGSVRELYRDFDRGDLQPLYISPPYSPERVMTPRFDLMLEAQLFPVSFEATRGCPFACDFCVLSALGPRFHTRPVEDVMRDVQVGLQQARAGAKWWEWHKRNVVAFYDNNIGGDFEWLRELATALAPLGIHWAAPITFNAVQDRELVQHLGQSGCSALFTGLETFNPETLADMRKHQNVLQATRQVVDQCHEAGILLVTGLMLSPVTDTMEYIRRIPELLDASGIRVPTFVALECPFPGTPHFKRLAAQEEPAFLPNALLRDFTGYTLVTRPQRESVADFIGGYRWLCGQAGSRPRRLRKLARELPVFVRRGHWAAALADVIENLIDTPSFVPAADRSCIAGTDTPPPEISRVPFTAADFDSEEQRASICDPTPVTDGDGRVLPQWRASQRVFGAKGRVIARPDWAFESAADGRSAPSVVLTA